jgi:hypothetical protein
MFESIIQKVYTFPDELIMEPCCALKYYPQIEVMLLVTNHFIYRAVFLNVYGAQESIPRNEFRQPM